MTSRRVAGLWIIFVLLLSLVIRIFLSASWTEPNADQMFQGPSWGHWFGTDSLGRDLFVRLFLGTWVSLFVGVGGSILSLSVGIPYGLVSGWIGGWIERLLMRATDILLSVPSFILVAVVSLGVQSHLSFSDGLLKSVLGLVLGVGFTHWMNVARVTRGLVLKTKVLPYIEAARALGATDLEILWRHILPNISGPLLVLLGLQIPANILYESFMSFIGVGIQAPETSWGLLVQEGWRSLSNAPHLMLFPALILFLTVWAIHILLDGIQRNRTSVDG